jgi:hypothetical protein
VGFGSSRLRLSRQSLPGRRTMRALYADCLAWHDPAWMRSCTQQLSGSMGLRILPAGQCCRPAALLSTWFRKYGHVWFAAPCRIGLRACPRARGALRALGRPGGLPYKDCRGLKTVSGASLAAIAAHRFAMPASGRFRDFRSQASDSASTRIVRIRGCWRTSQGPRSWDD